MPAPGATNHCRIPPTDAASATSSFTDRAQSNLASYNTTCTLATVLFCKHHQIVKVAIAAEKNCDRCFNYRYVDCDFYLGIDCALRWRVNPDDCHQHALIPILGQLQFTCRICGEESGDPAFLCSSCLLLTHDKCSKTQRRIKIRFHRHLLCLTCSLQRVKESHGQRCCEL